MGTGLQLEKCDSMVEPDPGQDQGYEDGSKQHVTQGKPGRPSGHLNGLITGTAGTQGTTKQKGQLGGWTIAPPRL